jgi:predicted enzyme related to lactoylglutathione lyase
VPTFGDGKICYLEIPAIDIACSADFYGRVFGWRIRKDGDGSVSFDDAVGEVSGMWVLGRPPSTAPGILISIMVDDVAASLDKIAATGGKVLQAIAPDAPAITATFSDPAGNVFCLYQHRSSKSA